MDAQETRMQCLKMAMELGGKPDAILSAAEQILNFVTGAKPATNDPAIEKHVIEAPVVAVPEATIVDTIAACGTALEIPDGGNLADAVLPVDAVTSEITAAAPAEHVDAAITEEAEQFAAPADEGAGTFKTPAAEVSAPATDAAPTPAEVVACVEANVEAETSIEPTSGGEDPVSSKLTAADQTKVEPVTTEAAPTESKVEPVPTHVAANEGAVTSEPSATHH